MNQKTTVGFPTSISLTCLVQRYVKKNLPSIFWSGEIWVKVSETLHYATPVNKDESNHCPTPKPDLMLLNTT